MISLSVVNKSNYLGGKNALSKLDLCKTLKSSSKVTEKFFFLTREPQKLSFACFPVSRRLLCCFEVKPAAFLYLFTNKKVDHYVSSFEMPTGHSKQKLQENEFQDPKTKGTEIVLDHIIHA